MPAPRSSRGPCKSSDLLSSSSRLSFLFVNVALLFPALRDQVMIFFLPGALFEWVAALWLLFAGIKIRNETQTAT